MVYVPGFSPFLEATERGGPAFVGQLPSIRPSAPPIMAPLRQPATPSIRPSAPPIMAAPVVPTAPPIMAPPPVPPGTPALSFSDLFPEGLTSEALGSMLSTAPGAAGRTISPEVGAYYGLTPTGLATRDGQQGVYLNDERGWRHSAGIGDTASGFIAADPNAQYRLTDERGKNSVVAEGTGLEGLMSVRNAASKLNMSGKDADWSVERLDPATGQWARVGENKPTTLMDQLGGALDVALPVAGAFLLPGVGGVLGGALGAGLGSAGGSALSSVAQGRSLDETLKRAALSGVAAGGLSAVGGTPLLGASPSGAVGGATAGGVAGANTMAQAGLNAAGLGGITVLGNAGGAALGTAAGAGLSGTLANMAPGRGADFADRTFEPAVQTPPPLDTATGSIIVRPTPAINPPPVAPASAGALSGFGGGSTLAQQPQQGPYRNEHGDLVLTGTSQPPGANIVSGALPGLTAGAPAYIPELVGNDILVQQNRRIEPVQEDPLSLPLPPPGLIPTTAYGTPAQNQSGPYRNEQGDLVLTGTTPPPVNPASAAGAAGAGLGYDTSGNLNEIVVQDRPNPPVNDPLAVPLPPIGSIPTTAYGTVGGLQTPQKPEGDGIFDNLDLVDYLRLAGLGIGTIGSLFEGGGRQTNGVIPGGLSGGLNSVFGGSLGAPTMPGAAGNFAPRPVNQDWMRYGYGPSQSFFNYVPQGQPNTSQAYTGYAEGGEVGGRSFAVDGPGTGRSDDIPALLSDGEYVIDAETVALLGDGSTEAGADRLDAFRVNIRKHKGAQLAKGGFSHDAKRPEQYLQGGLS
jgi:hypothetical protein